MSDILSSSRNRADPDAQAAAWVMRLDRGLTPEEQDEYLRWLAAAPVHGECLARQRQAWRRLDKLVDWRPEHSVNANPDLLAPPRRRRIAVIVPFALAAAAALAFVLLPARPRLAAPAARAVAAAPLAPAAAPATTEIAAGYEARQLPDGSLLELKDGAEVSWTYTAAERDVRLLKGEAHFTVAKNAARPFIVTAGGVGVRAVGTAFDVRLSGPQVEVLVTEGKVRVGVQHGSAEDLTGANALLLAAGHEATLSPSPSARPPRAVVVSDDQIERALAWRPEVINCTAEPLSGIVVRFNRHNRVRLILADAPTGALKLDLLSFRTDNVDSFVRLLSGYGVSASRSGDTITLTLDR